MPAVLTVGSDGAELLGYQVHPLTTVFGRRQLDFPWNNNTL